MSGIVFELDGRMVEALPGETLWTVAKRLGTDIPHLALNGGGTRLSAASVNGGIRIRARGTTGD